MQVLGLLNVKASALKKSLCAVMCAVCQIIHVAFSRIISLVKRFSDAKVKILHGPQGDKKVNEFPTPMQF